MIRVRGGHPLYGTVTVGGSKNAALPILFATLFLRGRTTVSRLPDLLDVRVALALLSELGAVVTYHDAHTVTVDTTDVRYFAHDEKLTRALRASTYLLGAELCRFGRSHLYDFGGCAFCDRPIDLHLLAIRAFGGEIDGREVALSHPHPASIRFPIPSVGATVNALYLASSIDGESILENVALEPHVLALVALLRSAGAQITLSGNSMRVRGGSLHGASVEIIPDMIEAGTYLFAGLITGGAVTVEGVDLSHLDATLYALSSMGAEIVRGDGLVRALATRPLVPIDVSATPYPGFPTDLAPPLGALLASLGGGSITDTVFPRRTGYVEQLARLGVDYRIDGDTVRFLRPPTQGGEMCVKDLRGGAAELLLALSTPCPTVLFGCELLHRGYEHFFSTLSSLGAELSTSDFIEY